MNDWPNVIAIDPGKATGVAEMIHDELETRTYSPDQFYDYCWALGESEPTGIVVLCEAFIITAATLRKTFQPWSLEMIGVVKAACHKGGHVVVEPLPKPSEAKSMIKDQVLHALGWWRPGYPHENDALRHLARYGMLNGYLDKVVLLSS